MFKSYLDMFGIEYDVMSVRRSADGEAYCICEHDAEAEKRFRNKCDKLITVCDNARINGGYKPGAFTKSWYDTNARDRDVFKRIRSDTRYFFETIAKAKAKDILFTCPEEYFDKVKGQGYTCVRRLTKEENNLPDKERKKLKKKLDCFVPLNARASNDYCERWALAYIHNMNPNTMIKGFFEDSGIDFNKDLFAISCLIQWIFRSRVRNDQDVILYLPSPRMRKLFRLWIDGNL